MEQRTKPRNFRLFQVFGGKAAVSFDVSHDKMYLTVAPKMQDGDQDGKQYNWAKKKAFKIERHELLMIKEGMRQALFNGVQAAKAFCVSMQGQDRNAPYFLHRNPQSNKKAMGGIVWREASDTDERFASYAPFVFQISYLGSDSSAPSETLSCPVSKTNAYQIIHDIEAFLSESVRVQVSRVMGGDEGVEDIHAIPPRHVSSIPAAGPAPQMAAVAAGADSVDDLLDI